MIDLRAQSARWLAALDADAVQVMLPCWAVLPYVIFKDRETLEIIIRRECFRVVVDDGKITIVQTITAAAGNFSL
jgi:hypothetical protein